MLGIDQNFIINWMDLIWILPAIFIPAKQHKFIAVCFVLMSSITLRMEVELVHALGVTGGLTGLIEMSQHLRAQITYSITTLLYLIMSFYSKRTKAVIYMAASLTIYFFTSILTIVIISI